MTMAAALTAGLAARAALATAGATATAATTATAAALRAMFAATMAMRGMTLAVALGWVCGTLRTTGAALGCVTPGATAATATAATAIAIGTTLTGLSRRLGTRNTG